MKQLLEALLKEKNLTKQKVEVLKMRYAGKLNINEPLSSDVLAYAKSHCNAEDYERLRKVLVTKPTRTLSGVAVVAVMAKPAPCPGTCIYCPKGKTAPQSYTGLEPAAMRAVANDYDPYKQVKNRLTQLQAVGHSTEKCELIIMGGTFPAIDWTYQKWFVKRCFEAFNDKTSKTLKEAQTVNETAKNRIIGLTIETRADYVFPEKLLELGCTRVELGVQTVYDSILKKVCRGSTVEDTAKATKLLKEYGFKILYHMMPGLPGSSYLKDVLTFWKIFHDQRFKPDMLKIYPTLVIEGTKLYDLYQKGKYNPIDEKYMIKLLRRIFRMCPSYVRIHRVQRDIPSEKIIAGPRQSNLREVAEKNIETNEMRHREIGHVQKVPESVEILVKKYKASGGDEYFISAEDKKMKILLGFCRLRIAVSKKAFIRELHVYGETLPLGTKVVGTQHSGWGKKLVAKAEEIAKSAGSDKIYVISGIGVKKYYADKHSYEYDGPYMSKPL